MKDDNYILAEEAAALLGVTIDTFYVYVSRKNLRSVAVPNSRKRRYWRPDVEQLRRREIKSPAATRDRITGSSITLWTEDDLFYRGHSVRELVKWPSFEAVAALLWNVENDAVFDDTLPTLPESFAGIRRALEAESPVVQAIALLPLLERTNPRSQDFSPLGMARSGAHVLNVFTTLLLGQDRVERGLIHERIAVALGLTEQQASLLRTVMILTADHGLELATYAVRSVVSTGVSPWRAVPVGLITAVGRRTHPVQFTAIDRLIDEIIAADQPFEPLIRRVQEGEAIAGFALVADQPVGTVLDVRAAVLRDLLEADYADDRDFRCLATAISAARDMGGYEPSFSLLAAFIRWKLGLRPVEAIYFLARAAGWIAHTIEQSLAGERERLEPHYSGPLPVGEDWEAGKRSS